MTLAATDPSFLGPIRKRVLSNDGPLNDDPSILVIDAKNFCFWRGRYRKPYQAGKTIFRIASALVLFMPNIVAWDTLIDHVYGDHDDGGPENIRRVFYVEIYRHAELFRFLGFRVANAAGRGYCAEPIDAESFAEPATIDLGPMTRVVVQPGEITHHVIP